MLQQLSIIYIIGPQREGTDIHFIQRLLELSFSNLNRITITWEQDIATYYLLLQFTVCFLIILVVNGIPIAVHLIDGIIRWRIHSFHIPVNSIFRIKEVSHLHAFLDIVLRQLQYNIRLLRNGRNNKVLHADRVILLFCMLRIINKLCQLHAIFSKQYSRMLALT